MNGVVAKALRVAQSQPARWGFGVVATALAVWAVASQWTEVVAAAGRLRPEWLVLALVATVGNACLAGMVWRSVLTDLGSRLPLTASARIFFVGQLGKYVPGSVWPMVMQAEMGSDYGVARRRTAAASVVAMLLGVASGLGLVLVALPFVPDAVPGAFGWAVAGIVPLAVVLHPALLGRGIDLGLRALGRERLDRRTSLAGTAVATGWSVGSWLAAGLQVWALSVPLGAPVSARGVVLVTAGYALAWTAGFVIVVAPAGAGAREFVLGVVLTPVLDPGAVVVVVLLSRALFTLSDLGLAATGVGIGRARRRATVS